MKKTIVLFLFLVIFLPVISAIEINMDSEFLQGETIIASFSGNFLDSITRNNIHFYRGYVETFFNYDFAKIGDSYYLYFQSAGKSPNNYSVNITDVRYLAGSQISTQQISKKFEIKNEIADFSVNPGFILTDENFSLKLQNLQESGIEIAIKTTINSGGSKGNFEFLSFLSGGREIENLIILDSKQTDYLEVILKGITETTIRTISLSTDNLEYNIPIYIIAQNPSENPPGENESNIEDKTNITNETEKCSWLAELFGCVEENKTSAKENKTIYNKSTDTAHNGTDKDSSIWDIFRKKNESVNKSNTTSLLSKTCAEIKGKVCPQGEVCSNSTVPTKDANCCISSCVKEGKKQNNKIIGWAIIAVIFLAIILFFRTKFRKTKNKRDFLLGDKNR